MITVKRRIEVRRSGRGKRVLVADGTAPPPVPEARQPGVPRVARLLAIAIGLEGRIREGLVRDHRPRSAPSRSRPDSVTPTPLTASRPIARGRRRIASSTA